MAKETTLTGVQTTFTKQKRELAKAESLISTIRAQEKRALRYSPKDELETEERVSYLVETPEEIAKKVLAVVAEVVRQHGSRQKANGTNTGRFEFADVVVDLTVPQLRALQEAVGVISKLVEKLPVENKRFVPNTEVDGRPAFRTPMVEHKVVKKRVVPFEEKDSTRIRTYEESWEDVDYKTCEVTVDYGLPLARVNALKEAVADLRTAIQVAIDEANAKARGEDEVLNATIQKLVAYFEKEING